MKMVEFGQPNQGGSGNVKAQVGTRDRICRFLVDANGTAV